MEPGQGRQGEVYNTGRLKGGRLRSRRIEDSTARMPDFSELGLVFTLSERPQPTS